MELNSDDARRHLLHQRLAQRWIRDGGVVIAKGAARAGARSTFDLAESVASGPTLQVTFNLREVGKACRVLRDYAIYLWTCEREGEYLLCGRCENEAYGCAATGGCPSLRKLAPTCYAGSHPSLRLDIYDAEKNAAATAATLMVRMLLPRGQCAAIYQPGAVKRENRLT